MHHSRTRPLRWAMSMMTMRVVLLSLVSVQRQCLGIYVDCRENFRGRATNLYPQGFRLHYVTEGNSQGCCPMSQGSSPPASDLLRLSAQIVSAHVVNKAVPPPALPGLIRSVLAAL